MQYFNVATHNSLIDAFVTANQPDQALEVVREIHQRGTGAEDAAYRALINALAQINQL